MTVREALQRAIRPSKTGVFVGFGALISVIRRDVIDAAQLSQIRTVVAIGLVAIDAPRAGKPR
jgi:hypothetical protein